MTMRFAALLVATPLTFWALPAVAKEPAAQCPSEPQIPAELSDWAQVSSAKTMSEYSEAGFANWMPLTARRTGLALHPSDDLAFWATPERALAFDAFGGSIPVEVARAGRLTIALDQAAWIDLVRDGQVVKSVGHGHGPDCSGIRKMVHFDVTPGRYLLQIVNAPERSIRAMAVLREQP